MDGGATEGPQVSIVRENLMSQPGYQPYCGGEKCRIMPRTKWSAFYSQFVCPICEWRSSFEPAFIAEYKAKWGIGAAS